MRLVPVAALFFVAAPVFAHPPAGVITSEEPIPPRRPVVLGESASRLDELQGELSRAKLDGWLLTDFRGEDDVAISLAHPKGTPSRRWFYFIPSAGEPVALMFHIEAPLFDEVPGKKIAWASWRDLDAKLHALLKGRKRIALAWSAKGELPSASRVDAGVVEAVRGTGVQIVPSGDLVTFAVARWTEPQRQSHLFAVKQLEAVKSEAWLRVVNATTAGARLTERDLVDLLRAGMAARGLESETLPVVAVDAHTADPEFHNPEAGAGAEIHTGSLIRIELSARQVALPGAIFAAGVWTGFVGQAAPDPVRAAWTAVRDARERAVALVRERRGKRVAVRGFEVDAAVRALLDEKFFGAAIHPTGHSLDTHGYGDGPDLDDLESHDDRQLLAHTGYLVAPGVYVAGEFGVASGLDIYIGDETVDVTTEKPQEELELIHVTRPAPAVSPALVKPKVEAPPPPPPVKKIGETSKLPKS